MDPYITKKASGSVLILVFVFFMLIKLTHWKTI